MFCVTGRGGGFCYWLGGRWEGYERRSFRHIYDYIDIVAHVQVDLVRRGSGASGFCGTETGWMVGLSSWRLAPGPLGLQHPKATNVMLYRVG